MIQSRLREIRTQKGLTLQQVADRAGTTAQTIGRLETGMRTLSVKWINRIAEALGTDPAELLSLPEQGDIEITGDIGKNGLLNKKRFGTVSLRFAAKRPIAIRIRANLGEYRAGDALICEGENANDFKNAVGRDCLVQTKSGAKLLAKVVAGSKKDTFTLVPAGSGGNVLEDQKLAHAAPVVNLLRTYRD